MHTILYCINASGSRLQKFETDQIIYFLKQKYIVVIVLTKSECISTNQINEFSNKIKNQVNEAISIEPELSIEPALSIKPALSIVPVCSIENNLVKISTPFGRDILLAEIQKNFIESIVLRLPDNCYHPTINAIDDWKKEQIRLINKKLKEGIFLKNPANELENTVGELENSLELLNQKISKIIPNKLSDVLNIYGGILKNIDREELKNASHFLELSSIVEVMGKFIDEPSIYNTIKDSASGALAAASVSTAVSTAVGVGVSEAARITVTNTLLTLVAGASGASYVPLVGGIGTGLAVVLSPLVPFLIPASIVIPSAIQGFKFWKKHKEKTKALEHIELMKSRANKAVNEAVESLNKTITEIADKRKIYAIDMLEEFKISLVEAFKADILLQDDGDDDIIDADFTESE